MNFEFATPTRIVFGCGSIQTAAEYINANALCLLAIVGKNPSRFEPFFNKINPTIKTIFYTINGEPTIELVEQGVQIARQHKCDMVAGIGGGSVIDAAKAISALITNSGKLIDYLEVIGHGKPLEKPAIPYIAIPTTAGTGAEVTKNAVITSTNYNVKASLRHQFLYPKLAVVDPELTISAPPELTASTGLDALTQLIEPFISAKSNPLTDALCIEGLKRIARSLKRAFENGKDLSARTDMALASLFSGMALANAGLGAVHGFAAPIGGSFPAPHGAVCAALLPPVMQVNLKALKERTPQSHTLEKIQTIARILTNNPNAVYEDAIHWLSDTCKYLKIKKLGELGIKQSDFPSIIEKAKKASSMKGNPIQLTDEELKEILLLAT
ncbi:MAG: iron-containing alcohol dehydrogenase [Verrucomicrobiae bacterium]|nr:iron-containing alcohol dehydrogenase [Verrucomicrobiae bacterium]